MSKKFAKLFDLEDGQLLVYIQDAEGGYEVVTRTDILGAQIKLTACFAEYDDAQALLDEVTQERAEDCFSSIQAKAYGV